MTKLFGIEFAPLRIPFERRLQTLSLLLGGTLFFGVGTTLSLLFIILTIYTLFTAYFFIPLIYYAWMYLDRETMNKGGRLRVWFRRLPIWTYYAAYFPVTLHKTVDLNPAKNYIFGYHPHGIISYGALLNFATEGTGFSKLFPGITSRLITLVINFKIPINREIMLLSGMCSSNKESIEYILTQLGSGGNAAVIVVGGAAEALDAVPNTMELTLKNRKGFVKVAIRNGASLVPVISFGENELYIQEKSSDESLLKQIQRKFTRAVTLSPPIFHGRGIFQYNIGLLPFRKPIHTIVGHPIDVVQNPNPSQEEVDTVHQRYMNELEKLFEENKVKYAEDPNMKLVFK